MTALGASLAPVAEALETGWREGVAPGLSAAVLFEGHLLHASVHGDAELEPEPRPLTADHLFDVASLTKVMATTTLAALLVGERRLSPEDPVARVLPAFAQGGKGAVTVRHLLAHTSGLPAWRPYFERARCDPVAGLAFLPLAERPADRLAEAFARGRRTVQQAVLEEPLEAPPGGRALYSDPGFMALGWVLEEVGGDRLDRLCQERIFEPLALASTFFLDAPSRALQPEPILGRREGRAFAATERCPHRRQVSRGEVSDDNAWAMGGVAGHAGLFSSPGDVAALGQVWLEALHGRPSLLDPATALLFARRDGAAGGTRALGWDTPSAEGSTLGTRLGRGPRGAIGHLGYTGCSLWIDVDRELACALLTNHVHPNGPDKPRINAFRRRFHDAVAEALGIG